MAPYLLDGSLTATDFLPSLEPKRQELPWRPHPGKDAAEGQLRAQSLDAGSWQVPMVLGKTVVLALWVGALGALGGLALHRRARAWIGRGQEPEADEDANVRSRRDGIKASPQHSPPQGPSRFFPVSQEEDEDDVEEDSPDEGDDDEEHQGLKMYSTLW